jgi:hypothetical protein
MSRALISIFAAGTAPERIEAQRTALAQPGDGIDFLQLQSNLDREQTVDYLLRNTTYDQLLFVDVDCLALPSDPQWIARTR